MCFHTGLVTGSTDGTHKSVAERAVGHKEIQDTVICNVAVHYYIGGRILFIPVWRFQDSPVFHFILVADSDRLDRLQEQEDIECHGALPADCEDGSAGHGMPGLQGVLEKRFAEQRRRAVPGRGHVSRMLSACPGRNRGRRCEAFRDAGLLSGERGGFYRDFFDCLDCGAVQHCRFAVKEGKPETGDTVCTFYFDRNLDYHDVRSVEADYEEKSDFIILRPVRFVLVYGDIRRSK